MAQHLSYDFVGPAEKQLIRDVARACNIRPGEEPRPTIPVPTGWQFLPSSDGVGTLAPAGLFCPQPLDEFDRYGPPISFVQAAERALKEGYLATALHYLREGLCYCWVNKPYDLARRMVDVYNMLNRQILAIELTHTMNRW